MEEEETVWKMESLVGVSVQDPDQGWRGCERGRAGEGGCLHRGPEDQGGGPGAGGAGGRPGHPGRRQARHPRRHRHPHSLAG